MACWRLEPLDGHSFGAEITGFDISTALTSPDANAIRADCLAAFARYGLLIFRGQQLEPDQELQFAKWFPYDEAAPVEERAGPYTTEFVKWKLPETPEVQVQVSSHRFNH